MKTHHKPDYAEILTLVVSVALGMLVILSTIETQIIDFTSGVMIGFVTAHIVSWLRKFYLYNDNNE